MLREKTGVNNTSCHFFYNYVEIYVTKSKQKIPRQNRRGSKTWHMQNDKNGRKPETKKEHKEVSNRRTDTRL